MNFSKWLFCILASTSLLGCSFSHEKDRPSVLIVAVDSLPSDLLTCSESEESLKNLAALCAESVRFTHAFTTSTLAVPALSSILTALLPTKTGLTDNSRWLTAGVKSLPEYAVQRGYKTILISGGAPLLGKTGLGQGFEVFDDAFKPSSDRLYRPLEESQAIFQAWLKSEVGKDPFLGMLYSPEIQFIEIATRSEFGVGRDTSFVSQMETFDLGLGRLVQSLKAAKRWENTYFVLVGLSGISPAERFNALPGTNLFLENSQVGLLIKPARPKRDRGLSWKIDENVSIVDLGATLFEAVGERIPGGADGVSLLPSLYELRSGLQTDRALPVFDHWSAWRKLGPARLAIVHQSDLYIVDRSIRAYNTLLDRNQTSPQLLTELPLELQSKVKEWGYERPNRDEDASKFQAFDLARRVLSDQRPNPEALKRLKQESASFRDPVVTGWSALVALRQKDWRWLDSMGRKLNSSEVRLTATKWLSKTGAVKSPVNVSDVQPCLRAFLQRSMESIESLCRDPDLLALGRVMMGSDSRSDFESMARRLDRLRLERKILATSFAAGYVWDGPVESLLSPTLLELALNWPENQMVLQKLTRDFGHLQ